MTEGEEAVFDFGKKKKPKKDKKTKEEGGDVVFTEAVFNKGEEYDYDFLLKRLHETMMIKTPALGVNKKYVMKPPKMIRVGSKKVGWVNFAEICNLMGRPMDHVMAYCVAEFGTEGNIAGEGQLILKGRFSDKHLESLLRKYIKEYVTCQMCKSASTRLERDAATRLQMVVCNNCTAQRSCAPIKSGFHATSKGDRKKLKFKTATQIKG